MQSASLLAMFMCYDVCTVRSVGHIQMWKNHEKKEKKVCTSNTNKS